MMKNVLIAVLTVTTIAFGYMAFFDSSSKNILQQGPVEESESLAHYLDRKFFDNTFVPIRDQDKGIRIDSLISEYHLRVLPVLKPRRGKAKGRQEESSPKYNKTDGWATMVVKFASNDVKNLISQSKSDTLFIHFGAYYYSLAHQDSTNNGRKKEESIFKPTLIIVAPAMDSVAGFSGSNFILGGQICPPPKGCL